MFNEEFSDLQTLDDDDFDEPADENDDAAD